MSNYQPSHSYEHLIVPKIIGYCVIEVLMKNPHLLLWINLLNGLSGWFLPPPCTTNRPVTIIMISCVCQNKSQQRLITGSWMIWLNLFRVYHKISMFLVIAYLPDFL